MYLKSCRSCPHNNGCAIKAEKVAALRGLGITNVTFKCAKRLSQLQPGQRIEFRMADYAEEEWSEYTFQAIVMCPVGVKIRVWLLSRDDDIYEGPGPHPQLYYGDADEHLLASGKNPITVSPARVRPVGGRVHLCPDCDQPEGTRPAEERKSTEPWFCPRCAGWEQVVRDGWTEWVEPRKELA